jgi:hypothetical protein
MSEQSSRRRGRPPIVWPVILIGIGVLVLLQNFGYLQAGFWQIIWPLWPILLILIGVEIIIGYMRLPWPVTMLLALIVVLITIGGVVYLATQGSLPGAVSAGEPQHVEQNLQGATSAAVALNYGAGQLKVGALGTDSSLIMAGDFTSINGREGVDVTYTSSSGRGDLSLSLPQNQTVWFLTGRGNVWNVQLNRDIPFELDIESGASTNDIDATDLKLTRLSLQGGLGTNTVHLPSTGVYTARLASGLATTTVYVPDNVAARITVQSGLSSMTIDESRFPRQGDLYLSPNYDSAANRVDLQIEGGLAAVVVR